MAQKQAVNCDSDFGLRFSKNVFGCGVFNLDAMSQKLWANFSAIVYIAVWIHVMFDNMNQNTGFYP